MSTPINMRMCNNLGVILEPADNSLLGLQQGQGIGAAYVRQIGLSVQNCAIDDLVAYLTKPSFSFQQSAITYLFVDSQYLLYVQDPIP